jgi:hypothetical protein
MRRGA